MKTLEQRMKTLEEASSRQTELLAEIHAFLTTGRIPEPGRPEYDRAIQALLAGDKGPLDLYLARGGELPEATTPYKPYVPRKRKETPPPAASNIREFPGNLPEVVRGASFDRPKPNRDGYASP